MSIFFAWLDFLNEFEYYWNKHKNKPYFPWESDSSISEDPIASQTSSSGQTQSGQSQRGVKAVQ